MSTAATAAAAAAAAAAATAAPAPAAAAAVGCFLRRISGDHLAPVARAPPPAVSHAVGSAHASEQSLKTPVLCLHKTLAASSNLTGECLCRPFLMQPKIQT